MLKVVILAGGYGKRLRPLTETLPKSLLPVAGKSILEWQLKWIKHYGFNDVLLCVGYLWDKVKEKIGDGSRYGVKVTYVIESEPLGTGGALMNAKKELRDVEKFIVINGDILTNLDLRMLSSTLDRFIGAIALTPLPSPFGIVDFEKNTLMIKSFIEKPRIRDYWINAGAYIFSSEVFTYLPVKGDIERTSFPRMAEEGRLKALLFPDAFWMSIDSHKDLEEASKIIGDVYPFSEVIEEKEKYDYSHSIV